MQAMKRVAILGAGITGLATAWKLRQSGMDAVLFEASDHAGGVIQSLRHEGYLLELGPNTVLERGGALTELMDGLGLRAQIQNPLPAARKRFVLHQGRVRAIPMSLAGLVASPILSWRGKLRLVGEPFRAAGVSGDESVSAFFSRRIGAEVVDRLLDPFVSGIYAGDPVRLSARHAFPQLWQWERESGSLLRGALQGRKGPRVRSKMISFPEGLQTLTRALTQALEGRIRWGEAAQIACTSGGWRVNAEEKFDAVVSTLPPLSLACTLETAFPTLSTQALRTYPQAAVRIWHFGVERRHVRHPLDGFGVLAPSSEGEPILGILFSSSIFPGRAPEGKVLLTVFQGGVRHPHWAEAAGELEARQQAWEAVGRWLGIEADPEMVRTTVWKPAIPQYEVGHQSRLDALEAIESAYPGLWLRGNLRGGVSVGDCVASAFETARQVAAGN
jgi:oxygen-dependent protoporphyrinogen oxidase